MNVMSNAHEGVRRERCEDECAELEERMLVMSFKKREGGCACTTTSNSYHLG